LKKRNTVVEKRDIDTFWRFGQSLIQNSKLMVDVYKFFTESEKQDSKVESGPSDVKLHLNETELSRIKDFASNTSNGEFTVFKELPKMIAPYISGNEELKLALCYSLASSYDKPVHLLMIGNPASVKSDLISEVKEIFPTAILGGPRSTQSGLTINSQDGSPGLLLRANNGLALIDEFDKIQKSEITATYEALENGRISVNTGKCKGDYPSKFIMIAAANPKGGRFSANPESIKQQIETVIPAPLLSRFHLIFLLRRESREKTEQAITTILTRKDKINPDINFLRNYFNYVKYCVKKVDYNFTDKDPLIKDMSHFVLDVLERSENGLLCYSITKRLAEAMKRISISSARLRLSNKVEEVDVRNAIEALNAMLSTASI
jgi:replicative DNA helicase Mcm